MVPQVDMRKLGHESPDPCYTQGGDEGEQLTSICASKRDLCRKETELSILPGRSRAPSPYAKPAFLLSP